MKATIRTIALLAAFALVVTGIMFAMGHSAPDHPCNGAASDCYIAPMKLPSR